MAFIAWSALVVSPSPCIKLPFLVLCPIKCRALLSSSSSRTSCSGLRHIRPQNTTDFFNSSKIWFFGASFQFFQNLDKVFAFDFDIDSPTATHTHVQPTRAICPRCTTTPSCERATNAWPTACAPRRNASADRQTRLQRPRWCGRPVPLRPRRGWMPTALRGAKAVAYAKEAQALCSAMLPQRALATIRHLCHRHT